MWSRPPKIFSRDDARVERRLLHAIIKMETDPMKRANDVLPSPTASEKANQPIHNEKIANNGPSV
jgi:hypothetical protein